MRTCFAATIAILVACVAGAQADGQKIYATPVARISVRLVPDKSTILLGEPTYVSFIVDNHSSHDIWIIVGSEQIPEANNPAKFRFTAAARDGTLLAPPPPLNSRSVAYDVMVGPNTVPAGKSYTFHRFLPQELPIRRPGVYTLTCRKLLRVQKPTSGYDPRAKTDAVETVASASLTVEPADARRMGVVIDQLGRAAAADFHGNGSFEESAARAAGALSVIPDPRAIPWFIKLLNTHNSDRKTIAVGALSRFNSVDAFNAVKAALDTKGSEIDNCTTAAVASEAAREVRLDAVRALAQSPYRAAMPLLLTFRHNHDEEVRLQVVHACGETRNDATTAALQEMAADSNETVRQEAQRYLKSRKLSN